MTATPGAGGGHEPGRATARVRAVVTALADPVPGLARTLLAAEALGWTSPELAVVAVDPFAVAGPSGTAATGAGVDDRERNRRRAPGPDRPSAPRQPAPGAGVRGATAAARAAPAGTSPRPTATPAIRGPLADAGVGSLPGSTGAAGPADAPASGGSSTGIPVDGPGRARVPTGVAGGAAAPGRGGTGSAGLWPGAQADPPADVVGFAELATRRLASLLGTPAGHPAASRPARSPATAGPDGGAPGRRGATAPGPHPGGGRRDGTGPGDAPGAAEPAEESAGTPPTGDDHAARGPRFSLRRRGPHMVHGGASPTATSSGPLGPAGEGGRGSASAPVPDDASPEELVELVAEVLAEQARRHGVDLS